MEDMWYYKYAVTVWEEEQGCMVKRTGVTAGTSIKEAFDRVFNYYGNDIEEINQFKPITDTVLEFDYINHLEDLDFSIKE